jgi:hypothetical protein
MTMLKLSAAAATAATLALAGGAQAQDQPPPKPVSWEFATGADYSVGRYGAAEDTKVLYLPLTVRARTERWRVEATVPYLSVEGPGSFVGGGGPIFIPPGGAGVSRRSGLGDVVLGAGWTVSPAAVGRPSVELFGSVKLPTADEALGTEKTDLSVAINLNHYVSQKLWVSGGVGYEWLGDPSAYRLEDGLFGNLGLGYAPNDRLSYGAGLNFRHRTTDALDAQLTASPWISWRPSPTWGVTTYGYAGLNSSSPDYGIGFQLSLYR